MSSIAFNNQQLKQKNEEMKEILGEMSIRRQFIDGGDETATNKDMMIEKLRYKVRILKKKVRQEDDDAMSDSDDDADDEAEYDSSDSGMSLTINELIALNLPTTANSDSDDDTDDDIANNGRDIDDDIEIEESITQPIPHCSTSQPIPHCSTSRPIPQSSTSQSSTSQSSTPQQPIPCMPSTSTGIIYHMFEYQTPFN